MNYCKIQKHLAYIACIYIIASLWYLVVTRQYGTPFGDALENYPELKEIKFKSADQRRTAFYMGLGVAILVMVLMKPFENCMC